MKKVVAVLLFITGSVLSYAQTPPATGEQGHSYTEEIITDLPRAIIRSHKPGEMPSAVDTVIPVPEMKYSNIPGSAMVHYEPIRFTAVNATEKLRIPKLYRFYTKVGIGNYTMPYAEIIFNDTYNKKGTYGLMMKHHSSSGGLKDVGYSAFSDNEIGLYGKTFIKKYELGGDFDYKRNVLHYYGYKPDSILNFSDEQLEQNFQYFGGRVYLGTFYPDSLKINHREEMKYYYLEDHFGASENLFEANTRISKRVGKELMGFGFSFLFNRFIPTTFDSICQTCFEDPLARVDQDNVVVNFNPTVNSSGKNWVMKAGIKVALDSYDSGGTFHFFPDAEFRYSLFNDILVPYIGIGGGIKKNTYRSLTSENPFILSDFQLRNTNQKILIYAGIRGTWSSTLSFNGKFSYDKSGGVPLFVNDTLHSPGSKFSVLYDQVETMSISGQINWQKDEKIKLLVRGEYFLYSPLQEVKAWGLPGFTFTTSAIYNLYDKILFRADIFVVGNRWARSYSPVEGVEKERGVYPVKLKPFADINLGFEYRYTKRLSVFLNFNNIAAQRYQYWNNYPVMGINLLGGLTYAF